MPLMPTQGLFADVVLLGWTEPYHYDSGLIEGNPFPAGTSFQLVVGIGDGGDFEILKVKTAGARVAESFVMSGVQRGIAVRIEYLPGVKGRNGRPAELLGIWRADDAAAAAGANGGKAHAKAGSEGG